jgi:hypothetical protein
MDTFEKRLSAAASAAWWVVLIAAGFLTLVWLIYLGMVSARPAWMLSMWGPDVDWQFAQKVSLCAIAAFKCCVWLMASGALWLTLWARRLRKLQATGERQP